VQARNIYIHIAELKKEQKAMEKEREKQGVTWGMGE